MNEPYKFKVGDVCPRRDPTLPHVTIVCIDAAGTQPIIGTWVNIDNYTMVHTFTTNGYFYANKRRDKYDILPPIPAKVEERKAREWWIVFRNHVEAPKAYDTKQVSLFPFLEQIHVREVLPDQPQEPKKEGLTFEEWKRSFEVCESIVGNLAAMEKSLKHLASFLLPHEQEKGKE